jgi:hypothetical protein
VCASRATDADAVEQLGEAALPFDAVGGWAQIYPFVLHSAMNIVTACALRSADDTTHTIAAHQGGQSLLARILV